MSTRDCLLIFAPFLIGCPLAAAVDIALRVHGGAATPTPVHTGLTLAIACVGRAFRTAAARPGVRRGRA